MCCSPSDRVEPTFCFNVQHAGACNTFKLVALITLVALTALVLLGGVLCVLAQQGLNLGLINSFAQQIAARWLYLGIGVTAVILAAKSVVTIAILSSYLSKAYSENELRRFNLDQTIHDEYIDEKLEFNQYYWEIEKEGVYPLRIRVSPTDYFTIGFKTNEDRQHYMGHCGYLNGKAQYEASDTYPLGYISRCFSQVERDNHLAEAQQLGPRFFRVLHKNIPGTKDTVSIVIIHRKVGGPEVVGYYKPGRLGNIIAQLTNDTDLKDFDQSKESEPNLDTTKEIKKENEPVDSPAELNTQQAPKSNSENGTKTDFKVDKSEATEKGKEPVVNPAELNTLRAPKSNSENGIKTDLKVDKSEATEKVKEPVVNPVEAFEREFPFNADNEYTLEQVEKFMPFDESLRKTLTIGKSLEHLEMRVDAHELETFKTTIKKIRHNQYYTAQLTLKSSNYGNRVGNVYAFSYGSEEKMRFFKPHANAIYEQAIQALKQHKFYSRNQLQTVLDEYGAKNNLNDLLTKNLFAVETSFTVDKIKLDVFLYRDGKGISYKIVDFPEERAWCSDRLKPIELPLSSSAPHSAQEPVKEAESKKKDSPTAKESVKKETNGAQVPIPPTSSEDIFTLEEAASLLTPNEVALITRETSFLKQAKGMFTTFTYLATAKRPALYLVLYSQFNEGKIDVTPLYCRSEKVRSEFITPQLQDYVDIGMIRRESGDIPAEEGGQPPGISQEYNLPILLALNGDTYIYQKTSYGQLYYVAFYKQKDALYFDFAKQGTESSEQTLEKFKTRLAEKVNNYREQTQYINKLDQRIISDATYQTHHLLDKVWPKADVVPESKNYYLTEELKEKNHALTAVYFKREGEIVKRVVSTSDLKKFLDENGLTIEAHDKLFSQPTWPEAVGQHLLKESGIQFQETSKMIPQEYCQFGLRLNQIEMTYVVETDKDNSLIRHYFNPKIEGTVKNLVKEKDLRPSEVRHNGKEKLARVCSRTKVYADESKLYHMLFYYEKKAWAQLVIVNHKGECHSSYFPASKINEKLQEQEGKSERLTCDPHDPTVEESLKGSIKPYVDNTEWFLPSYAKMNFTGTSIVGFACCLERDDSNQFKISYRFFDLEKEKAEHDAFVESLKNATSINLGPGKK